MASSTEATARLYEQLRERLDLADRLAAEARRFLLVGDAASIEDATARMETLAQEVKVLIAEQQRLVPTAAASDEHLERARAELERSATRVARSAAIGGGLLERMVVVSRGLIDLIGAARHGTYERSGRAAALEPGGVRLKEWV